MNSQDKKTGVQIPVQFGADIDQVGQIAGPWTQKHDEKDFLVFIQGQRNNEPKPDPLTQPGFQHMGLLPTAVEYCFERGMLTQLQVFHEDRTVEEVRSLLVSAYGMEPKEEGQWDVDGIRVALFPHASGHGCMIVYVPLPGWTK
jgi:hypothetical protein